jgi:replicative DNA helicase
MKTPPHSNEAEQWVLGGLMLDANAADEVFGQITAEDFYRHDHQLIFSAIVSLHVARKPIGFVTLADALRDAGTLENAGGLSYIGTLANDTPSAVNILSHAKIVREQSQRRALIALAGQIGTSAWTDDAETLAATLAQGVEQITRSVSAKSKRFVELYAEAEASIEAAKARRASGGISGVSTGIPALDSRTGGLQKQRLYGIAARPGCGKTALLNQIGVHAASKGHAGLICSLEMGGDELILRALANASGGNLTKISMGLEPDINDAMNASDSLSGIPLWVDTETYSLNGIIAQMAAHKHKYGIEWAAVDHIGLIETQKFNSRNDQIGFITRSLKQAAKRLGIAVIALSQLSRNSETQGRKPGLHDLRDSGNIEQDLDAALFLHVDADKRDETVKQLQVGLLKNRNGRVGWFSEQIEFNGQNQRIREIAQARDVPQHWQDVA